MELVTFIFPASLFTFMAAVFLSRNPVYGILSFVVVVLHVVTLLIVLDLEFLAYVLAIVYIGAMVVLFLFVVMMFYIHHFKNKRSYLRGLIEYYLLGWCASNMAYYLAFFDYSDHVDHLSTVFASGLISTSAWYLFNDALLLTILAALMMLMGIVGAIILTMRTKSSSFANSLSSFKASDIAHHVMEKLK